MQEFAKATIRPVPPALATPEAAASVDGYASGTPSMQLLQMRGALDRGPSVRPGLVLQAALNPSSTIVRSRPSLPAGVTLATFARGIVAPPDVADRGWRGGAFVPRRERDRRLSGWAPLVDAARSQPWQKPVLQKKGLPVGSEAIGIDGQAGPLQLTRLNFGKSDKISGISDWIRRPSSNAKGQGQHLTAYVAFQDMILSHVRGRTISQAAAQLLIVIDAIKALPGAEHLYGGYVVAFEKCKERLKEATTMLDQKEARETVEAVIGDILSLRNKLPDTALTTSEKTPGHGEAKSSGILNVMENTLRKAKPFPADWGDDKAIANSLLFSMWRLLDYQPSSGASSNAFAKTKQRVLRHVMQMRLSYPLVSKWLTEHDCDLMTYLAKNYRKGEMPLSKLSAEEIAALSSHVVENTSDAADEKMAEASTSTTTTTTSSGPSQHTRSKTKVTKKGDEMDL